MSLQQKRLQKVALRKRKEVMRDDQDGYEQAFLSIEATVQPLGGHTAAQMYGARLSKTKLLLTAPGAPIAEGMGVCVGVPPEDSPDYKVVYVSPWLRHTAAHIEFVPEPERMVPGA